VGTNPYAEPPLNLLLDRRVHLRLCDLGHGHLMSLGQPLARRVIRGGLRPAYRQVTLLGRIGLS